MGAEGEARDADERRASDLFAQIFGDCTDSTAIKLANFPKYVRRQDITKFLVRYELMKKVLGVKGSIVECGVFRGSGVMTWAKLSALLEPYNLMRRVYGFDSFQGFPAVAPEDASDHDAAYVGQLKSNSLDELHQLVGAYDLNRPLGHFPKVELVVGDAVDTIPAFIDRMPHLVVSLLFLDFDLYEPTRVAIETLRPRMPKGAIIAFDELDHPAWPGETKAVLDSGILTGLRLERLPFDPYVTYAVL